MPRTKKPTTVGKSKVESKQSKQSKQSKESKESKESRPTVSTDTAQNSLQPQESSIGHYTFTHRSSDNYINLTKMLRQVGRNVNDYMDLKSTQAYIHFVSNQVGIPVDNLVYVVKGRTGTWAHPIIATHAAQWASHEMSYAVAQLVDRFRNADTRLALDVVTRTKDDMNSPVGQAIVERSMDQMNDNVQERLMARQQIKLTTTKLNRALASAQTSRKVYGAVQNAITLSLYQKKVNELKAEMGVPYEISLRESMDTDRLVEMAYVELLARRSIENDESIRGDNACVEVSARSAELVRQLTSYSFVSKPLPVQGSLFDVQVQAVEVKELETTPTAV